MRVVYLSFTESITQYFNFLCCICTSYYILLISRDYCILSEFTIALLEDSGWYKANYTALYNLKQNPLQWGKGKLCRTQVLTYISKIFFYRIGMSIFN